MHDEWFKDEDALCESEYQYHLDKQCARANEQASAKSLRLLVELGILMNIDALDEYGYVNDVLVVRVLDVIRSHEALEREGAVPSVKLPANEVALDLHPPQRDPGAMPASMSTPGRALLAHRELDPGVAVSFASGPLRERFCVELLQHEAMLAIAAELKPLVSCSEASDGVGVPLRLPGSLVILLTLRGLSVPRKPPNCDEWTAATRTRTATNTSTLTTVDWLDLLK